MTPVRIIIRTYQRSDHDRVPPGELDERPSDGSRERVEHAEADHHVADVTDAVRAADECLTEVT